MVLQTDIDKIAGIIFEMIKHGDENHQAWLKEKSRDVAGAVVEEIESLMDWME